MKFKTGSAFRQSLGEHILNRHHKTAIPLERIRKIIVFDRFLDRLSRAMPNQWVLKGGYMLEIYYPDRVRTTKDIDLLFLDNGINIFEQFFRSGKTDLGDWFTFEVQSPIDISHESSKQYRINIRAMLDSRIFEAFHVDVNTSDTLVSKPVIKNGMDFLGFAEINPVRIPCYSLEQQLAEKLHSLSKEYQAEKVSRVKDLVDILFLASNYAFSFEKLAKAIEFTFSNRATHKLPAISPRINEIYLKTYEKLAKETGLAFRKLIDGNRALEFIINPILSRNGKFKHWDPTTWRWK
jgi:predicted nucleotidyltransferase component of viral defense system